MGKLNIHWIPMTLREVVGLFTLPQKKPSDAIPTIPQKALDTIPKIGTVIPWDDVDGRRIK